MYTFNRNNRECIHKLKADATFYDFTDTEDFYLVSNKLNISYIKKNDMVKFYLYDDRIKNDKQIQKVYGFVMYLENIKDNTFMVCRHYDEHGNIFYLDYIYSSFHHAFIRINKHGSFSDWNQQTHVNGAHAPSGFIEYWINTHVTVEQTTECADEEEYKTLQIENTYYSVQPGHEYTKIQSSNIENDIYYK